MLPSTFDRVSYPRTNILSIKHQYTALTQVRAHIVGVKMDGNTRENTSTILNFTFVFLDRNENSKFGNENDQRNIGNPKTVQFERECTRNGQELVIHVGNITPKNHMLNNQSFTNTTTTKV